MSMKAMEYSNGRGGGLGRAVVGRGGGAELHGTSTISRAALHVGTGALGMTSLDETLFREIAQNPGVSVRVLSPPSPRG